MVSLAKERKSFFKIDSGNKEIAVLTPVIGHGRIDSLSWQLVGNFLFFCCRFKSWHVAYLICQQMEKNTMCQPVWAQPT